jgi:O-antigen/teichoic acid export membrane protein
MVVLGQKWLPAVAPLRFLAFYVTVRSLTPLIPVVLNVVGESRFNMWSSIAMALVLPVGFYIGSRWGNAGIAAAWMIAYPIAALPMYWRAFRKIEMPWLHYLRVLVPSAFGSVLMVFVVLAIQRSMSVGYSFPVRLSATVSAGAAAYLLVAGSLNFHRRHVLVKALKMLRA